MDCKEIITGYLIKNGYGGLYNPDVPCGCELGDLMPCCGEVFDCAPGYKHQNPNPKHVVRWAIFDSKETPSDEDWDGVEC